MLDAHKPARHNSKQDPRSRTTKFQYGVLSFRTLGQTLPDPTPPSPTWPPVFGHVVTRVGWSGLVNLAGVVAHCGDQHHGV